MTNKKKNIIEALRGSYMFNYNLPALISEETIYDETGHVDTEFMLAILECMEQMATTACNINKALNKLLGIDETEDVSKKKKDDGESWDAARILQHCTLEDNILRLPNVRLNKNSYLEAKKWIEEAGGKWSGGKTQGFTFVFDAKRVFDILHSGKRCNLFHEFQFFETPESVADWLVGLIGNITEADSVLEPSAGRGGLVKAIHRVCPPVVVDCYELMPENKEILSKLENINIVGDDFTQGCDKLYTKIVANPPFCSNQDIRHVRLMYNQLADGGTLVAIMSRHWVFGAEKECVEFRTWFEEVGGMSYNIDAGEFNSSGTSVATTAVVINKTIKKN